MTLKESEVNGELKIMKTFDDLQIGDIFEGTVTSTTDFGVFVKLDGTVNVSGLCHHSEISENDVDNVKLLFGTGDRVKVKILKIDSEKRQLSLGMKASYFIADSGKEDNDDEDVEMEDASEVEKKKKRVRTTKKANWRKRKKKKTMMMMTLWMLMTMTKTTLKTKNNQLMNHKKNPCPLDYQLMDLIGQLLF